jgi:4-hydroxy-4-methyl-2-oxoglutarate aldolase
VVVPFARIDEVAKGIERVKAVEDELEAKVKEGFRDALDIEAMLADGRAVRRG